MDALKDGGVLDLPSSVAPILWTRRFGVLLDGEDEGAVESSLPRAGTSGSVKTTS